MGQASQRVGIAVTVALALSAVAGCTGGSAEPPPAPATSSTAPGAPSQKGHAEYDFIPPPGFVQVPTDGHQGLVAEFTLPGEGANTVRANMTVAVSPVRTDLKAFTDDSKRSLLAAFPDYQPTVDEAFTLANGQRGWLLGGRYDLRGAPVQNLQLLLIGSQAKFVFNGLTAVGRAAEFDPVFRKSFATANVK